MKMRRPVDQQDARTALGSVARLPSASHRVTLARRFSR
ncbi:hypothetical protein PLANPX_4805 [Lacipirellula parvula]|uniref:Uncharacterized protein n=1 Tax=Lacipirellula parvula TaxID=2650471 RepID=A0A5K7XL65_9BACT|nr:hypothetical protein PLANPX_4805 [Lacipirellula parvula]